MSEQQQETQPQPEEQGRKLTKEDLYKIIEEQDAEEEKEKAHQARLLENKRLYPNLIPGANKFPLNNCASDLFKTEEAIKQACNDYCKYLEQGRDAKWYKHDKKIINHYIDKHPSAFPPERAEEARKTGLAKLESAFMAAAIGKQRVDENGKPYTPNPAMMIFLMKNKLKWSDRVEGTNVAVQVNNVTDDQLDRIIKG